MEAGFMKTGDSVFAWFDGRLCYVICALYATWLLFGCARLFRWRAKRDKPVKKAQPLPQPVRKAESHIQKIVKRANSKDNVPSSRGSIQKLDILTLGLETPELRKSTTRIAGATQITITTPANHEVSECSTQSSTEITREYDVIDPIPLEFPIFPGSETFLRDLDERDSQSTTQQAPNTLDAVSSTTMFPKTSPHESKSMRVAK